MRWRKSMAQNANARFQVLEANDLLMHRTLSIDDFSINAPSFSCW